MSNTLTKFVAAVRGGKNVKAAKLFKESLNTKLLSAINNRKATVAESMIGENVLDESRYETRLAKGAKYYPSSGKPSDKNYYVIGGDAYDGGVILKVIINGKQVYQGDRVGDGDFQYKNKPIKSLDSFLDQIAKEHGLDSGDDLQRYQYKD